MNISDAAKQAAYNCLHANVRWRDLDGKMAQIIQGAIDRENAALVKERDQYKTSLVTADERADRYLDEMSSLRAQLAERERDLTNLGNELFDCKAQLKYADDKLSETQENLKEAEKAANDKEARLGAIERGHECEGDGCPVCEELIREESQPDLPLIEEVREAIEYANGLVKKMGDGKGPHSL